MGILQENWIWILMAVLVLVFLIRKRLQRSSFAVVKQKLENGAVVVDVRSPAEFHGGHFPGALNIPLDALAGQLHKLGDKSQSIVVYCASGARSGVAKTILERAGFSDVINAGGLFHIMAHAS